MLDFKQIRLGSLLKGQYRGLAVDDEIVVVEIHPDGVSGRDGNYNKFFYSWDLVKDMKIVGPEKSSFASFKDLIKEIQNGEDHT